MLEDTNEFLERAFTNTNATTADTRKAVRSPRELFSNATYFLFFVIFVDSQYFFFVRRSKCDSFRALLCNEKDLFLYATSDEEKMLQEARIGGREEK